MSPNESEMRPKSADFIVLSLQMQERALPAVSDIFDCTPETSDNLVRLGLCQPPPAPRADSISRDDTTGLWIRVLKRTLLSELTGTGGARYGENTPNQA
jgi:hypothetical protein